MKTIIAIATDTKILDEGRVQNRVKEYAGLINGKYINLVFTNNSKKNNFEKIEDNFQLKAVYGKNKVLQLLNLYKKIKLIFKDYDEKKNLEFKNEIIFYPQDSFELGLISLILKYAFKSKNCKLYVQCHTDISHANFRNLNKRNHFQYFIAQIIFRKADKIRVVSQRMKNYLMKNLTIDENKILNLPIYFDHLGYDQVESHKKGHKEQDPDFLILSRIETEKNIGIAIEAIRIIRDQTGRDFKLKIFGSGTYKNHLQKKFSGADYNYISWSDWIDNPMQEYRNSKYFLLPSLYEGWGLTAIESVASGTPVIMTPVGCAGEFILDCVNGIVASGFEMENFVEAIRRAIVTGFTEDSLSRSILTLDTKEEYLEKLKLFLTN